MFEYKDSYRVAGANQMSRFVYSSSLVTLREYAYSNILKIVRQKNENFQMKNSDIFSYFCSKHRLWVLVLSRNKKNNAYPCKPQFYYIKVGFKGVKLYRHVS